LLDKNMKISGTLLLATKTLVKVREVGAKENVLVYGGGNEQLTVGGEYEFSHLIDGDKQFKSYKTTEETKVTDFKKHEFHKIKENDLKAGEKRRKHISDTALEQNGTVDDNKFGYQAKKKDDKLKNKNDIDKKEKTILRPQSQFSVSQANIVKTFIKCGKPLQQHSKVQGLKPKGKTYRRSKNNPTEVSMNDPKVKKKLEEYHRRDTKSGSRSYSSRMRLDPSRIRLGSDRFSRPRSDRIYNVEDTDEEEL